MDFDQMKRNLLPILLPLFFLLFCSTSTFAAQEPGLKGKVDLGAKLSHIAIGNSVVDGVDVSFDTVGTGFISLTYYPLNALSVELAAATFESDIELGAEEIFKPYGTFSQSSLYFTVRYEGERQKTDNFRLSIGAGLSRHFNDIERDSSQTQDVEDFFALNRTITKIEDSTGFHGTVGFEYALSDSLILNADVMLSSTEAKAVVRYPNATETESTMGMNAFVFGAGLKYRF